MRLGRPRRPGRALAALAIVALISALARGVWVNGVFSGVTPGFSGSCRTLGNLPGVQDMELASGTLFLSVASARGPGNADGIYAMALEGGTPVKLAGAPKDFHPRGIGLYRTPGTDNWILYAVNRRSTGRFSIDSFEVVHAGAVPALAAQGTIEGGLLINPQDVAVAGPNLFYVANGTAGSNVLIHGLQTYGIIPGGNVLYFNGTSFSAVADGLYGTRSLLLTLGGDHLIAGGLLSRSLTTFTRQPFTGALTEDNTLVLPAGPEKLSLDAQGQLWVAGHANLLNWRAMAADLLRRASSQILRVSLMNGVPQAAEQVYGNDGSELAGASVGLSAGKRLLIGSSLDGRLLDCTR
jgi:arylesterase / paraoxonase